METLSVLQKRISYVLKAIVILSAVLGTYLSGFAGRDVFMGGSKVFMYFTIQSNILIAMICGIGCYYMAKGMEPKPLWYVIKFVGTVAITLTGVVFCVVLAPTLGKYAWNIQNVLTHVVVPVVAVIDFFVTCSKARINKKNTVFVIIPPVLYAIYAGIGFALKWEFGGGVNYPYFFLNWGSPAGAFGFTKGMPYMGTAWWIAALLIFLMIVGFCYLCIADLIDKALTGKGGKS